MRTIEYSCIVEANLGDIWEAWTTNEGVRSFFAPDSNVELKIGGPYELFFHPDAPDGQRGSEGMKIQTYIPERLLAFDWNNPPSLADIRGEKTWVVIEFHEMDEELCEITLTHLGWKDGERWEQAYQYFINAWKIVLDRFERRMKVGEFDWEQVRSSN